MAMHMTRLQAYPSGSAVRKSTVPVRMRPPSCVEVYMEYPSEDYQSPSKDTHSQTTSSGRPLAARKTWPSARKMGSKMYQKLQQHEEDLESPEPEPPGWSYHDAAPAEAGGGLSSLAAKRKIFWASQLRKPKVEDETSNKAKRPAPSPSAMAKEVIAWKVTEALALSTIALALDDRARKASEMSKRCKQKLVEALCLLVWRYL